MQKKRVLLIGGAGTLGSDILDAHLPDYELFVIDNFSESALTQEELQGKVSYKNLSVADENGLIKMFQEFRPEVVIYLATTLSKDQLRAYESNVLGMANMIKAAEQSSKPYLIFVQSFLTRNCESKISVNSQVEARNSYAVWKLAAEYLLNNYSGSQTTIIVANVLSPRLNVGAIPAFVTRIQNGEQISVTDTDRDYIDTSCFISALVKLIEHEMKPEIAVLGSSNPTSTKDILAKTAFFLGKDLNELDYSLIPPMPSDPKTVTIGDSLGCTNDFKIRDLDFNIRTVVNNILESNRNNRQHHLEA